MVTKSKFIVSIVFLLFVFILAEISYAQNFEDKSRQIDAIAAKYVKGNVPGMAILVIRDGKILHEKGYGSANIETKTPIDSNTIFDTASVAKPITAIAVMMLSERGKLDYEDTLDKYFSNAPAYMKKITVRSLLQHTSGIFDYYSLAEDSQKIKQQSRKWKSNADVINFLFGLPKLNFPAGTKWEYSNSNYVILAAIVEKVSGAAFPQFVRRNIFEPLEMNSSSIGMNKALTDRYAVGYQADKNGFKKAESFIPIEIYGDGYFYTALEDLYKLNQALYNEKLVKNTTLREAFENGKLTDGAKTTYGFGWGLGQYLGFRYVSHGGDGDGFFAQITRFPEQKFTVAILCNNQTLPAPFAFANKIAGIYLSDGSAVPKAVNISEKILKNYVGTYRLYDSAVRIVYEKQELFLVTSGENRVKLQAASENEFFISGQPSLFVEFNKNDAGVVRSLTFLDQNGIQFYKQ